MKTTKLLSNIEFELVANHPALDFVNTEIKREGDRFDLLQSFGHLVVWLTQASLLEPDLVEQVLSRWDGSAEGADLLDRARAFRQHLRAIVDSIVKGKKIESGQISEINTLLSQRAGQLQLVPEGTGYVARFRYCIDAPLHLLVPVAEAAASLLSEADWTLISRCDDPACIRYFYDTTKNHSRRWCSMDSCGNRMKVAAYYARRKKFPRERT